MVRKPQQQTLSIRISDALRDFLERSKLVISSARGESVSTSDVAKILLESAKDDRLDFRLEAAELQKSPTESLWNIRRKCEQRQSLSRAEWVFLSQYVVVACEELSENPEMPPAASFAAVLEALRAVRALRAQRGIGLDRYYLGNLGTEAGHALNDRQLDPDVVPEVVSRLIQQLRESPKPEKPVYVGRCFYVALRDEELPDVVALNHALQPNVDPLFRLAARGHWIRERRPVHGTVTSGRIIADEIPNVAASGLRLSFSVGSEGEVAILLRIPERDLMYPLGPYPEIREFIAMLERLKAGQFWRGRHFYAYTFKQDDDPVRFYFRRPSDGVTLGFSSDEWQALKGLFTKALKMPALQKMFAELSLVYGEI